MYAFTLLQLLQPTRSKYINISNKITE